MVSVVPEGEVAERYLLLVLSAYGYELRASSYELWGSSFKVRTIVLPLKCLAKVGSFLLLASDS